MTHSCSSEEREKRRDEKRREEKKREEKRRTEFTNDDVIDVNRREKQ
jgi:hypothetical protein